MNTPHPPPPGKEVAWRCSAAGYTVLVKARLAYEARKLACQLMQRDGIRVDEQDIEVRLHETNGRVHVVGDGFEILGPVSHA